MKKIQVSLGVIHDHQGNILLAKRNKPGPLQGYWEFPGGKVDAAETYKCALRRELLEELNIKVIVANKIFAFEYRYPDLLISFQVFRVSKYKGDVAGAEDQQIRWLDVKDLCMQNLPPANSVILDVLQLPADYMIADYDVLQNSLLHVVQARLEEGISIIQLRAKSMSKDDFVSLADQLFYLCQQYQANCIANCHLSWLMDCKTRQVHLDSVQLKQLTASDPLPDSIEVFSAACHDEAEIHCANMLGARCILLGAVNQTQSHPQSRPIGWSRFLQLCNLANCPVYALGGLGVKDIPTALAFGAQGIAGIRDFNGDVAAGQH